MRLYPVTSKFTSTNTNKKEEKFEKQGSMQCYVQSDLSLMPHYGMYSVFFTGRTPEDFYAQGFNRDAMPETMKKYLFRDYDKNQHMPPEQMMQQAFEYLEIVDNFDEVKDLYPEEPLFENLHEPTKVLSSVAYEINVAKELANEPLFKNGDDNFGIYLLKKVYLEGKTIKEIDKDFYEKDINPMYKGVVSKPITKDVFRIYGIKYPESAFWNSFIATRDEYKKFFLTLPKNPEIQAIKESKEVKKDNSITTSVSIKRAPQPRKYTIKEYKKNQFAKVVTDAKGDLNQVEIILKRRYGSEDPEASFFLKYMSPIMTLVADRIHLSEAIRDFHDLEVTKGFLGDDDVMLKRFWKNNPTVLEDLSKTIPSTIELFEEVYGAGGNIQLNKDLKIVTPESNDVVIDKVSPEFFELLEYTQNIEANRLRRYAKHDELQAEWEKYFIDKYGEVSTVEDKKSSETIIQSYQVPKTESVEKQKGPKTFTNLEDALRERLYALPKKYADKYIKDFMNNPNVTENYKQDILRQRYAFIDYEKENVLDDIEYNDDYMAKNVKEFSALLFAYSDLFQKYLPKDSLLYALRENDYFNANSFCYLDIIDGEYAEFCDKHRGELNSLYNNYTRPLSSSEAVKVTNLIMDKLMVIDGKGIPKPHKSQEPSDALTFTYMLRCMATLSKERKKVIKDTIQKLVLTDFPFARALLNGEGLTEETNFIRFLGFMNIVFNDVFLVSPSIFCGTFNKTTVQWYLQCFSEDVKRAIEKILLEANQHELFLYQLTDDDIKNGIDSKIPRKMTEWSM